MRVATNERVIYRKTRSMQRLFTFGMLALLVSLAFSFNAQYVAWAYPVLLFGTVTLILASHAAAKWGEGLRGDRVLGRVLKSLDQDYRLYNYVFPADHVMLSRAGVFVFQLQRQRGAVDCEGERCRQRLKLHEWFRFAQEELLGDPVKRARIAAAKMQNYIRDKLPPTEVSVTPVVVFIHPDVQLDVRSPNIPIVSLADLKVYLRDTVRTMHMPHETYTALIRVLDEQAG